jgi:hypothetical protein
MRLKNKTARCIILELKRQYEQSVKLWTGRRGFDAKRLHIFWRVYQRR